MNKKDVVRNILKPLVFLLSLLPFIFILLGIFWHGSTFQLELGADPQKYIVHKMGLWTLKFLIITLAITPFRKWLHQPVLIQFRRMLGLFAMFYASMHLLSYYLLYLQSDLGNVAEDIVKRPYITIGFLAFLLLIPLAVTSTNKMMKRLGKKWLKLHRLIYIIVILGAIHFTWQVKSDLNEPLAYFTVVLLLLATRIRWNRIVLLNRGT